MRVFRGFFGSLSNTAVAIGNFDGMHRAHQKIVNHLVAQSQKNGWESTILTFRPNPKEFFNPKAAPAPLMRLHEKLRFLQKMGIDNAVICPFNTQFANQSADDFICKFKAFFNAQFVLVGDDFHFGKNRTGNIQTLKNAGLNVHRIPSVFVDSERISSSVIRQYLSHADLKSAKKLLGRDFAISGRVQRGRALGRTLGFATANLNLPFLTLPLQGVFAVTVRIENDCASLLKGVANVGTRPSVENSNSPLLEVHLFDFKENIYQKRLHVYFQHFLRREKHFATLKDLKAQIAQDIQAARSFFNERLSP